MRASLRSMTALGDDETTDLERRLPGRGLGETWNGLRERDQSALTLEVRVRQFLEALDVIAVRSDG
jgi:hypothetical protein